MPSLLNQLKLQPPLAMTGFTIMTVGLNIFDSINPAAAINAAYCCQGWLKQRIILR
jgi:hypothetical protein